MQIPMARMPLAVAACLMLGCTPQQPRLVLPQPRRLSTEAPTETSTAQASPIEEVPRRAQPTRLRALVLLDGRVRGVVPDGWVQLPDRSSREEVIFQIQNPADEGTQDAANAAVLVPPKWPTVEAATDGMLAMITSMPGGVVVSNLEVSDGKRVILARIFIEKTPYVVIVCIGTRADLVVLTHAAYPLLEATPPGWEDAMLSNYKALLSSLRVDDASVFPGSDPTSTVNP